MSAATPQLLTGLLHDVSRSFYLTLRVLPGAIRPQLGLAYLLARTSDTIADTEIIPPAQRLSALNALRERILSANSAPPDLGQIAREQGVPAERALLDRFEEAVAVLHDFNSADQQRIREVLDIITRGQELDLQRFGAANEQNIVALRTAAELDDYTYRVAGCVGEFWTKMCRTHLFPTAPVDDSFLLTNGVRLGKGLQLVNILRDLPKDLRQGRCYLPAEELRQFNLTPAELLTVTSESRLRPLYQKYLALAEDHLTAGWAYTNALPRSCQRVRLACAWPILIGMRTLRRLHAANVLDATQRVKVSRAEVRSVILRSVAACLWAPSWERLFERAR